MLNLDYSFTRPITFTALAPLMQQTAWMQTRTAEAVHLMLQNSFLVVGVWHDDRLIGFGRAVGDDVYRAFIEDIVVDAAYRKQGIGGGIVEQMLSRLGHIEEVILNCEPGLVPFYAQHGFKMREMPHMHIYRQRD